MAATVIIVLGMHRSYTSLLASWLHCNGVVMYDRSDPEHLYEDLDILKLHEDILGSMEMNWLNARGPRLIAHKHYHRLAEAIWHRKSQDHIAWGWKDPRTCLFYEDLWKPLARDAKVIFVYRHPASVVTSLFVREIERRKKLHRYVPGNFIEWYVKRQRTQYFHLYLNCWNLYNRYCLHIVHSLPDTSYVVVDGVEAAEHEVALRHTLQRWGVAPKDTWLESLFKTSTIALSADLRHLRSDLLEEAEEIFRALEKLNTFRKKTRKAFP